MLSVFTGASVSMTSVISKLKLQIPKCLSISLAHKTFKANKTVSSCGYSLNRNDPTITLILLQAIPLIPLISVDITFFTNSF